MARTHRSRNASVVVHFGKSGPENAKSSVMPFFTPSSSEPKPVTCGPSGEVLLMTIRIPFEAAVHVPQPVNLSADVAVSHEPLIALATHAFSVAKPPASQHTGMFPGVFQSDVLRTKSCELF